MSFKFDLKILQEFTALWANLARVEGISVCFLVEKI